MSNPIKDLYEGEHVFSSYLVTAANKCVSGKGKPYLNITLQDNTGEINAKKWEVEKDDLEIFKAGNIVSIEGEVLFYNGFNQIKILSGELVPLTDPKEAVKYASSAPVSEEDMEKELNDIVESFQNAKVKTLVSYLIEKFHDKYVTYPAAVRNHHNFVSGLLYHSLSMTHLCEAVAKLYPELNRDILIAGALLHDMGKTIEYTSAIAPRYSTEGKLLGHISIMQAELREAAQKLGIEGDVPVCLEHMILSSHTKPEYGSPVPPLTMEAIALSMIDDFDAKMAMTKRAYEDIKPGEFTQRIFPLGDVCLYKPDYDK